MLLPRNANSTATPAMRSAPSRGAACGLAHALACICVLCVSQLAVRAEEPGEEAKMPMKAKGVDRHGLAYDVNDDDDVLAASEDEDQQLLNDCTNVQDQVSTYRDMECFRKALGKRPGAVQPQPHPNGDVCDLHTCNSSTAAKRETDPVKYKGHLQFLGKQGQPIKPIPEMLSCPDAATFLKNYVYPHKPVVLRGCAKHTSKLWKDPAFLKELGRTTDWNPIVEHQKKIIRNDRGPASTMPFAEFVDRYVNESLYLVSEPPFDARKYLPIPDQLACSRTLQTIDNIHIWMSAGGTCSSLHLDTNDNLIVQLQGDKEIILADPMDSKYVYMDYHNKYGLSPLNVEKVDLDIFPEVRKLPLMTTTLHESDLLYIPTHWWHQLNGPEAAPGVPPGNIGVSFSWYSRRFTRDPRLLRLTDIDMDVLTASKMRRTSLAWRTDISSAQAHEAALCGIESDQAASSADVCYDQLDNHWWFYGLHDVYTTDEFFESWLAKRVEAAKATASTSLLRLQCMISAAWWFKEEDEGWILHMGAHEADGWEWPVYMKLTKENFLHFEELGYFDLIMKFDTKQDWLDLLHDSASKFQITYHMQNNTLKGLDGHVFGTVSSMTVLKDLPRCIAVLDVNIAPDWMKGQSCDATVPIQPPPADDGHRCDIERVDGRNVTALDLWSKYSHRPIIFTNMTDHWLAHKKWDLENFVEHYGEHHIPMQHVRDKHNHTVREFLSKRSGEHAVMYNDNSTQGKGDSKLYVAMADDYDIPPAFHSSSRYGTLSIGGNVHGVTHQQHQVAWLTLVRGLKHWFVAAPGTDKPDNPSCDYETDVEQPISWQLQCVQQPGDTLWLPKDWWHATCNLDPFTLGIGGQGRIRGLSKIGEMPDHIAHALQISEYNETFLEWMKPRG